jgi:hypothetical protein
MTRTFGVTAAVLFAVLVSTQFARVFPPAMAGFTPSVATSAPAEATAPDAATKALEDLAAWPMASGR